MNYGLKLLKKSKIVLFVSEINSKYVMKKISIIFILIILLSGCNKSGKESNSFDPNNEVKVEISNQIENVFFALMNGEYGNGKLSNLDSTSFPFYNVDSPTLLAINLLSMEILRGNFTIETKDIEILNITEKTADVKYDLVITYSGKEKIVPTTMILKKIGGNWKLDGRRIFQQDSVYKNEVQEEEVYEGNSAEVGENELSGDDSVNGTNQDAASEIETLYFGENVLNGKVILKNLIHPVKGTVIKDAMILLLPNKVKFIGDEGESTITNSIRVYGNLNSDPNIVYKDLINKNVIIKANVVFAPSGNYPLDANIIEDFTYEFK